MSDLFDTRRHHCPVVAMRSSLKDLREAAGMSQQECAVALGVTRQGHFDPRLSLALRIARLCRLSVDRVFTPDDLD